MLANLLESLSGISGYFTTIFTLILMVVPAAYIFFQYTTKDRFQLIFEDDHQKIISRFTKLIWKLINLMMLASVLTILPLTIEVGNSDTFKLICDIIFSLSFIVCGTWLIINLFIILCFKKEFYRLYINSIILFFYGFWYSYGTTIDIPKNELTKLENTFNFFLFFQYIKFDNLIFIFMYVSIFIMYTEFHSERTNKPYFYRIKQLDHNILKDDMYCRLYTLKNNRIVLSTVEEASNKNRAETYVYEIENETSFLYTIDYLDENPTWISKQIKYIWNDFILKYIKELRKLND